MRHRTARIYIAIATLGVLALLMCAALPSAPEMPRTESGPAVPLTPVPETITHIEIIDSCGPHYEGECVAARSGPDSSSPVVTALRSGMVLAVATSTVTDAEGRSWYQVHFPEWIRYPGRLPDTWYVAQEYARGFHEAPETEYDASMPSFVEEAGKAFGIITEKRIIIDRSEQKLYAYAGDTLFMETSISTGLDLTPTPRGTFTVYRKTPSRYMQGPLPGISDQYYDLPGVPWNLYFTKEGGAIHGAYWHEEFGEQYSHGCVNLPITHARALYEWTPIGAPVLVRD